MKDLKTQLRKGIADIELFSIIKGNETVKEQLRTTLLLGRHVILVGPPGVGKTTLAKSISSILPEIEVNDCGFNCSPEKPVCPICKSSRVLKKKMLKDRFVRIQGSPDLTVEDLIGDIDPIKAIEKGPLSLEAFTPGKIFKANEGILFFDEVNRCPEKLQNSLLQVLEEGKATIGNYSYEFPARFVFIGTMNPEDSSTERLSEVFLDRFDVIYMTYPKTLDIEKEIVSMRMEDLGIKFPQTLMDMTIGFIQGLRMDKNLEKKPGVRATIGLVDRAQAHAFVRKKKSVDFDDIRDSIISVLSHRIKLRPSMRYVKSTEDYLTDRLKDFSKDMGSDSDGKESDSP